jgi:hypothetical protein
MSDLLVFGDSFPAGADLEELSDRFPVLVANQLQRNLIDFSKGSTSIDHMVWELMQYLKHNIPADDTIALICITDPSRTLYFDDNELVEITPHTNSNVSNAYFKYVHSSRLEQFNWEKNLGYMNYACRTHNIKAYFINNWTQLYDLSDIVDKSYEQSICGLLGADLREWDGRPGFNPFYEEIVKTKNKYFDEKYHPNKEGHKLIAQHIVKWIESDG